jgi:hypothetical protein
MTNYGLAGPMTDMSTVFAAKDESAVVEELTRGPRNCGRHRNRGRRMWWLPFVLGAFQ